MLINFRTEEVLCFQLTELDVVLETELIARPNLINLRTEEVLCFQLIISKQRKYFA